MIYLRLFETEEEYSSYMESDSLILPNVSLMGGNIVKFNLALNYDPTNGYEYVDLELPSGLKWAKCNVGAEKESDYGLYFAWGETVGYKDASSGKSFTPEDYKLEDGEAFDGKYIKYDSSDNKTLLELEDDAASVNMGGSWRTPSNEEYQELLNNTTNTWTTLNGVYGRLFTGNNGNSLFLPAASCCNNGNVDGVGSYGYYWSSSLYSGDPNGASILRFGLSYYNMSNYLRFFGYSVRGVMD